MAKRAIRPIRIEGNLAYVPLTKGYEAVIDAADAHLVGGKNWTAHVKDGTVYAVRKITISKKTRVKEWMHRLILDAPKDMHVDHADGDGLNNKRNNVRLATPAQNMQNRGVHRDSKTGLKGAWFDKSAKKFRAKIVAEGKQTHLGFFDTAEKAHEAYMQAARDLHGQFAWGQLA